MIQPLCWTQATPVLAATPMDTGNVEHVYGVSTTAGVENGEEGALQAADLCRMGGAAVGFGVLTRLDRSCP